jgi:arabinofuranosyltransferase
MALLPGLLLAALYEYHAYTAAGVLGFPLDDAWIHAQFARNLATGHGFSYTGGQWVSGSTAPAWTILLAFGYAVVRDVVIVSIVLGGLCQIAAGYYAVRLTELFGVPRSLACLAGTLTVVTPVVVWGAVSGMEVPLAGVLVLAGLYYHFTSRDFVGMRRYVGLTVLGASALARPESLAVVAVVLVSELFGRMSMRERIIRFLLGSLVAALPFAILVAFSYVTIGRPLPTTFYAKSGPGIVRAIEAGDSAMAKRTLLTFGPQAAANFWLVLRDQFGWVAWLIVVGAVAGMTSPNRRVALTLVVILVLVPYAMGLAAPQRLKPDNVRYAAQLVVTTSPLIVLGIWRSLRRPLLAIIVLVGIAVAVAIGAIHRAADYARAVKNIEELQVTAGRWLGSHVPPESVVATNDVGAIAYFSKRRILDLEGLVSPDVLPYRSRPDRGMRVAVDMRPAYLAIFPGWYPELSRSPMFTEIHRVHISDNYISAGDTLIIYETPWARDH